MTTNQFAKASEVPGDVRANQSQVQSDMHSAYTSAQQAADIDTAAQRQDAITNNMTPEQFYDLYGYWNWNLAKNNAKGNLNNKTYGNTLYNSRLADAFNNRKYWKAARIGQRTNSGFGSTAVQQGQAIQYNPIETQETRQQRANEQIDLLARQGQQNLATNMQGYKFELQKSADKIKQELASLVSRNGIDLSKHVQESIWDKKFGGSFDAYWNNEMQKFAKELDVDIKDRVLEKLAQLKHPYQEIYASLHGGNAPSFLTDLAMQYVNSVTADIADPKEKATTLANSLAVLLGIISKSVGEAGGNVLSGLVKGFLGIGGD